MMLTGSHIASLLGGWQDALTPVRKKVAETFCCLAVSPDQSGEVSGGQQLNFKEKR
jgi:hypothetical protein